MSHTPYKPVPRELVNTGEIATIYLIHFLHPFGHARHYMGWTTDLKQRLRSHQRGYGGRLMAAVTAEGIGWTVVRTWEGDRNFERQMKNNGGLGRCCPTCSDRPRFALLAEI